MNGHLEGLLFFISFKIRRYLYGIFTHFHVNIEHVSAYWNNN